MLRRPGGITRALKPAAEDKVNGTHKAQSGDDKGLGIQGLQVGIPGEGHKKIAANQQSY